MNFKGSELNQSLFCFCHLLSLLALAFAISNYSAFYNASYFLIIGGCVLMIK
jgi:hypothetical protein